MLGNFAKCLDKQSKCLMNGGKLQSRAMLINKQGSHTSNAISQDAISAGSRNLSSHNNKSHDPNTYSITLSSIRPVPNAYD